MGIVYILGFVTLFTGLFTIVSNLLYLNSTNVDLNKFFNTLNWVMGGAVLALIAVIVYNFFAKKKAYLLEIILSFAIIVAFVVFIIIANSHFSFNDLYTSYTIMLIQVFAAVVLLLGTRIAMVCLNHKQKKISEHLK